MGSLFGGSPSQSQSGYANLPTTGGVSQTTANTLATNLLGGLPQGNQSLRNSINWLTQLANPNSVGATELGNYYTGVMGNTNLAQNPYYTSAMGVLTNQEEQAMQNTLAQMGGQQNAAGQFYSSGAGNANTQAANAIEQTYANTAASTALSAEEAAQQAGLTAAAGLQSEATTLSGINQALASIGNMSESELMSFISSLAGGSSTGGSSSILGSLMSGAGSIISGIAGSGGLL